MENTVAPKATRDKSNLWVETDPETHQQFAAACRLLGGTMKANVNRFMRETIERAGLSAANTAPHASR